MIVRAVTIDEFLLITNLEYKDIKLYLKTAETYKLNLKCLVYYIKKSIPSIGVLVYVNKKKIFQPNHYHYTYLWFKNGLVTKGARQDLQNFLSYLCINYNSITFRLIGLEDYRSFINNDFNLKLHYTFIKKTDNTSYNYNVQKHYKRAVNINKLCFNEVELNKVLKYNLDFLIKNELIGNNECKILRRLLLNLDIDKLLFCFSITNSEMNILASGIVLLDQNKAYFLFCNTKKCEITSAINSYMYIKLQQELKNRDVYELDYMGANIPAIAEFKNNFNPDLIPYYIVTYKKPNIFKILFRFFKLVIKKGIKYIKYTYEP